MSLHAISNSEETLSFPGAFPDFNSFNAASTPDSNISIPDNSSSLSKSNMSLVSSNKSPIYSVHLLRMFVLP